MLQNNEIKRKIVKYVAREEKIVDELHSVSSIPSCHLIHDIPSFLSVSFL